jgi:hypothetical protein
MPSRVRSDEDLARIDELVADLGHVLKDNAVPLPLNITREDVELADAARIDVIRATNAVSTAALGSDPGSIEAARLAVDSARDAIRAARAAIHRRQV